MVSGCVCANGIAIGVGMAGRPCPPLIWLSWSLHNRLGSLLGAGLGNIGAVGGSPGAVYSGSVNGDDGWSTAAFDARREATLGAKKGIDCASA